jgi:biofilm protein TabA
MSFDVTRREFLIGALTFAVIPVVWSPQDPAPRIYKLAEWRKHKKLRSLERAFDFLETGNVETKPPGRYPLDGDRLYATVVEDKTMAVETAQFEEHRKYIDIHYLVRGKEMIGSADPSTLKAKKPYSTEIEAALYERPAKYKQLQLKPGEFTVFFPGQAHMPGCYLDKSEVIRKVVVKVLAESSST